MKLTMADCRAASFCSAGVRRYCEQYGVDFLEFVQNGHPIELVPADDALLAEAVEKAKERVSNGQG